MSEQRLIDANALLERVDEERKYLLERGLTGAEHILVHNFRDFIDNAPTVEPHYVSDLPDDAVKTLQTLAIDYSDGIAIFERKRPQGEWIIVSRNCWKCPYCQELTNEGKNFCPNCGADMRKENDNGKS